jgi:hypothetical protein
MKALLTFFAMCPPDDMGSTDAGGLYDGNINILNGSGY